MAKIFKRVIHKRFNKGIKIRRARDETIHI